MAPLVEIAWETKPSFFCADRKGMLHSTAGTLIFSHFHHYSPVFVCVCFNCLMVMPCMFQTGSLDEFSDSSGDQVVSVGMVPRSSKGNQRKPWQLMHQHGRERILSYPKNIGFDGTATSMQTQNTGLCHHILNMSIF